MKYKLTNSMKSTILLNSIVAMFFSIAILVFIYFVIISNSKVEFLDRENYIVNLGFVILILTIIYHLYSIFTFLKMRWNIDFIVQDKVLKIDNNVIKTIHIIEKNKDYIRGFRNKYFLVKFISDNKDMKIALNTKDTFDLKELLDKNTNVTTKINSDRFFN